MATTDVAAKWGLQDAFGLREYAGLQYKASAALTEAAVATFVASLVAHSECGVVRIEASEIDKTENVPTGDNQSAYVATILFQETDGDYKPSITIPGVKEASLQRDGKVLTLIPAAVSSIKAALETLTGKTFGANPRVMVYTRK